MASAKSNWLVIETMSCVDIPNRHLPVYHKWFSSYTTILHSEPTQYQGERKKRPGLGCFINFIYYKLGPKSLKLLLKDVVGLIYHAEVDVEYTPTLDLIDALVVTTSHVEGLNTHILIMI